MKNADGIVRWISRRLLINIILLFKQFSGCDSFFCTRIVSDYLNYYLFNLSEREREKVSLFPSLSHTHKVGTGCHVRLFLYTGCLFLIEQEPRGQYTTTISLMTKQICSLSTWQNRAMFVLKKHFFCPRMCVGHLGWNWDLLLSLGFGVIQLVFY